MKEFFYASFRGFGDNGAAVKILETTGIKQALTNLSAHAGIGMNEGSTIHIVQKILVLIIALKKEVLTRPYFSPRFT